MKTQTKFVLTIAVAGIMLGIPAVIAAAHSFYLDGDLFTTLSGCDDDDTVCDKQDGEWFVYLDDWYHLDSNGYSEVQGKLTFNLDYTCSSTTMQCLSCNGGACGGS